MPYHQSSGIKNWIFLTIFILSSILILTISSKEFYSADYNEWRKDWETLQNYISSVSPIPFTKLSKFTLAYLINSLVSDEDNRNLAWLNIVFLFIPIVCLAFMRGWRFAIAAGCVFLVALIFSPIPVYYLFSGALEVQSGVVIGLFISTLSVIAFCNKREHPKFLYLLLSLSGFALPIYKDTIAVVILFGFLILIVLNIFKPSIFTFPEPTRESIIALTKYGALPIILGMILSAHYNMAKYEFYLPIVYLIESRETSPGLYKNIEFFIGSIFSPNGGILIFWSLSLLIMIGGWRMLGLSPRRSVVYLGLICVLLTLIGLAKWWAPFGWDSWGNRLAIPSVFGLMVGMLLSLEPTQSKNIFSIKFLNKFNVFKWLLICPVIILSIHYLSVPYLSASFSTAMQSSLNPGSACQNMYRALQNEASGLGLKFWKSDIYYACVRERMLHLPRPR